MESLKEKTILEAFCRRNNAIIRVNAEGTVLKDAILRDVSLLEFSFGLEPDEGNVPMQSIDCLFRTWNPEQYLRLIKTGRRIVIEGTPSESDGKISCVVSNAKPVNTCELQGSKCTLSANEYKWIVEGVETVALCNLPQLIQRISSGFRSLSSVENFEYTEASDLRKEIHDEMTLLGFLIQLEKIKKPNQDLFMPEVNHTVLSEMTF